MTSTDTLARIIATLATREGDFTTPIPNLSFFRRENASPPCACLVEPSIILMAQGTKQMWVGGQAYRYDTSNFLITSLNLPANSEVVAASAKEPCLGLVLKLDLRALAEMIAQGHMPSPAGRQPASGVGVGTAVPEIVSPFVRLLALLEEPDAISVLAPLIEREIHYRLLKSEQADLLRQIVSVDSQGHRISRAVDWLKMNFAQPLRVEELAAQVQMSAPTFHHHFRKLTAMSPLQYQKFMRLNEAKRLMMNEHLDAASAAYKVGYESPSQFSREYGRLFGAPPKKDIAALRAQAEAIE